MDDVVEVPCVDSTSKDTVVDLDSVEAVDKVSLLYLIREVLNVNEEDIQIGELKRCETLTVAESNLKKEKDQNVPKPSIQQRQTESPGIYLFTITIF